MTNGDSAAGSLRASGLEGTVTIWSDVLHDGPVPARVPGEQGFEVRARYLADSGYVPFEVALAAYRRWNDAIEAAQREGEEIVLWFEHDLYDQLLLIDLLNRFGWGQPGRPPASLICIDRFPGIVRFYGLGQLSPAQLASLFPTRRPVTGAQTTLAARAWSAFTGSDPTAIAAVIADDTRALPFLAPALSRLLEEYPSVENGLNRTEQTALLIATDRTTPPTPATGPLMTARDLFRAELETEEAPFLGDSTFFAMLERLADDVQPLIAIEGGESEKEGDRLTVIGNGRVSVTPFGKDVLDGRADAVRTNGIDRWIGGVHLAGRQSVWRWDRKTRRLVQA